MANPEINIADNGIYRYLDRFLEWSVALNYSQDTIRSRKAGIRRFIGWCEPRGLDRPQDITKPILERYRIHLTHYRKEDGQPLSFSSQSSLLVPLKAFFKWLNKENHILYNPAADFELPKVPKHLPRHFFSFEEIDQLLKQTQAYGTLGIRDRAIMETFYSTGIRRMELANLKLQDLDLKRGTIVIFEGKWKKDRVLPIGERACQSIQEYLDKVRSSLILSEDSGYVFLTDNGQPYHKNRLNDLVRKYMLACGIDKPGACKLFRTSMATHMLDNGADIRYIQMMLGHANLSTTEIYTQVSIKKLKEVHAMTHPARLNGQDD